MPILKLPFQKINQLNNYTNFAYLLKE